MSAGTAVATWLGAAARERGWLEERLGQELQLTKIHSLLVRQGVSVPYRTLHRFCVVELGIRLCGEEVDLRRGAYRSLASPPGVWAWRRGGS